MKTLLYTFVAVFLLASTGHSQGIWNKKFEQLGTELHTPNTYRTASGAPGTDYWQQRADYELDIVLDDDNQRITGSGTIKYYNFSPDVLTYLWVQLDQNVRAKDSNTPKAEARRLYSPRWGDTINTAILSYFFPDENYEGGFTITSLTDLKGNTLDYVVNKTMLRIDLRESLSPDETFRFRISWSYPINNRMTLGGRSGYEYFPADDNYLYAIAQFYPRMAVYSDIEGWQNKQFLGRGEFALPFGDFDVSITAPSDHVVAATGVLRNAEDVLTKAQLSRLERAERTYDKPVFIVTASEALRNEGSRAGGTKTWNFRAENVRDFAFSSSRKFIWDAMAVDVGEKTSMAMSYYPKEGNPLWEKESTLAVARALETYSHFTIDYPYPVAISVHTADIGMEYPMICFNFGRPNKDGSYTDRTRSRMIGVIVHEVGHNFFPMIINSDERQWTWMDEGLNSFVEALTLRRHYPEIPLRRGTAISIVNYMKGDKQRIRPIMVNSEQIIQFGNNAYGKPASALNILRETVMGEELFDYAFKEYAERWAFKHPTPSDFFRTMEDASGVDLDWFWRGWFYSTDHVDLAIDDIQWYRLAAAKSVQEQNIIGGVDSPSVEPMRSPSKVLVVTPSEKSVRTEFLDLLDNAEVMRQNAQKNFYQVTLSNQGGLVMPVILKWEYTDGSEEIERLPAEIWRQNEQQVVKVFPKTKQVASLKLDPLLETADVNVENNVFPRVDTATEVEKFKERQSGG